MACLFCECAETLVELSCGHSICAQCLEDTRSAFDYDVCLQCGQSYSIVAPRNRFVVPLSRAVQFEKRLLQLAKESIKNRSIYFNIVDNVIDRQNISFSRVINAFLPTKYYYDYIDRALKATGIPKFARHKHKWFALRAIDPRIIPRQYAEIAGRFIRIDAHQFYAVRTKFVDDNTYYNMALACIKVDPFIFTAVKSSKLTILQYNQLAEIAFEAMPQLIEKINSTILFDDN